MLGGSFEKLTIELSCIILSKVKKIFNGAVIQFNILNVRNLKDAIEKCNGNSSCISNFKKQINETRDENKRLGSEIKEATKKIIDCTKNLKNLMEKLFKINKNTFKKLIEYERKSLKKTRKKIRKKFSKSYLFKIKL